MSADKDRIVPFRRRVPDEDSGFPGAEDSDGILDALDAADREAVPMLKQALAERRRMPSFPAGELAVAARRLREGIRADLWPYGWCAEPRTSIRRPCRSATPSWSFALWRRRSSPWATQMLDVEEQSTIAALEHADWPGTVVGLVAAGGGTAADAEDLVGFIAAWTHDVTADVDDAEVDADDPFGDDAFESDVALTAFESFSPPGKPPAWWTGTADWRSSAPGHCHVRSHARGTVTSTPMTTSRDRGPRPGSAKEREGR